MTSKPGSGAKLGVFLTLTIGFSLVFWTLIARGGGLDGAHADAWILGLMWSPGGAAILTKLYFDRTLRGLGWSWGKTRYQVGAYLLPLAYASCVYVTVWLVGLGSLNREVVAHAARKFGVSALPMPLALVAVFVIVGALGAVTQSIFALGEEIGWRGFLVPELAKSMSYAKTALVSGAIWALWHYPVVFFGGYRGKTPLWFSTICFTVLIIGISFPLAYLRLRSGSVWTAMFLHASHNLFIQTLYDRLTVDTGPTKWIVGEFGAGLAIAGVVVGILFWRMRGRLIAPITNQVDSSRVVEPAERQGSP